MSSTIIEAKFQALDQPLQSLQKLQRKNSSSITSRSICCSNSSSSGHHHPNRVTSPEQLRELVKNSRKYMKTRPTSAHHITCTTSTAPTTTTTGKSESTKSSSSKSNNNQSTSSLMSSLSQDLDSSPLASTWSHQKSKLAHQLVEHTLTVSTIEG
jgi:hypothetical protein